MAENSPLPKPIRLLIADDDLDDQLLIQDALKENDWTGNHLYFKNGEELLNHLKSQPPAEPTMIILDLNMPKKNGWETLTEIKNNNNLQHIPVLFLTTSNSERDIIKSYQLGGNTFFTKPAHFGELTAIVKSIKEYWATRAVFSH
tara:strand:+ start:2716 stop:3150 length:435 start_codon:yes stop_codon:yes gene_type:complete